MSGAAKNSLFLTVDPQGVEGGGHPSVPVDHPRHLPRQLVGTAAVQLTSAMSVSDGTLKLERFKLVSSIDFCDQALVRTRGWSQFAPVLEFAHSLVRLAKSRSKLEPSRATVSPTILSPALFKSNQFDSSAGKHRHQRP